MLKILCLTIVLGLCGADIPIVINTWNFQQANKNAWATLKARGSAIDALVKGCETCQDEQCDTTVGYGGSPDENGESTLDALIFDGYHKLIVSVLEIGDHGSGNNDGEEVVEVMDES